MASLKRSRNFSCMHSLVLFLSVFVFILCEDNALATVEKLAKFKRGQEFCKRIVCEKLECSDGVLIPKGSFSGCCDICIKISFKGLNDSCDEKVSRSFGVIAESRCKQGLKCEDGKCVWDGTASCLYQRYFREQIEGTEEYKESLWKPKCNNEGNYVAKQEKERKSICVNEEGVKIFGTGENEKGSCECSRCMHKRMMRKRDLYNTRVQEHCSASGNFDSLQCINDLCYCADQNTGHVKGKLVRREFLDKLSCFDSTNSEKDYIKNCEKELLRSRSLAHQLLQKGVKLLGIEGVKCDPDGTFSPKQCRSDRCVCTNNEGVGIESYYEEPSELDRLNINMTCYCARDEKQSLSRWTTIICDKYGNYPSFQCFDDQCECTDEDGNSISKKMDKNYIKHENCMKMLQKLKDLSDIDDYGDEDYDDEDYY